MGSGGKYAGRRYVNCRYLTQNRTRFIFSVNACLVGEKIPFSESDVSSIIYKKGNLIIIIIIIETIIIKQQNPQKDVQMCMSDLQSTHSLIVPWCNF